MKAALYLRQSLDHTGEQLGVQRQEEQCRQLCAARDYDVGEVITDNSVSASKGVRPGYTHLLDLIQRRAIDVVVVLRMDRLLRKLTDLEALIELSEATGVGIAAVDGNYDLTTANGRLVGRLLAVAARGEVEMKNERRILANAQAAKAGKPYGTGRAFGYQPDNTHLEPREAAVLREMAARVIKGHSYSEVAAWATQNGYTTTQGNPWRSITVRNRLMNKRYAGKRDYKGVEYDLKVDPVFDEATWRRLQLVIRHRQDPSPVLRPRTYLLTGLLYCHCGAHMIGRTVTDSKGGPRRRAYWCTACGLTKSAAALDHLITESVFYRLDSPEFEALLPQGAPDDGELHELLDQRAALTSRLDAFADDYALGILNRQQMARASATAHAELKRLDLEIGRVQRTGVVLSGGANLREAWEAAESVQWRRSLLALLIKRVEAGKNRRLPYYFIDGKRYRFEPASIDVGWLA